MLAAQSENGFAVRFQFAARSARLLVFGLWLQIHFCSGFSGPIIPSDVCANFAENLRNAAPGGESL
jgi:hypothetical protein